MKTSLSSITLALILVCGTTAFLAGCDRQEAGAAANPISVGTEIDDTVVTTKVKSALLGNEDIKGIDIKVETRKGMVLLSGFVDNPSQIERAVSVAKGVEGVKGVEMGMTLKEGKVTVGNQVDDGILTAKVKSALLAEKSIKSIQIAVVTSKGQVQLSGFVDSSAQIDRAIAVTQAVEGVQGVVNEMSVKK